MDISGYTQPNTGVIDWLFGGGLLLIFAGIVTTIVWAVGKIFASVKPAVTKQVTRKKDHK